MARREPIAVPSPDVCQQTVRGDDIFAFPLSPEQERMWRADQAQPGNSAYNAAFRWEVSGPVDHAALKYAFDEVVRRHESLRFSFSLLDGIPHQILANVSDLHISIEDLGSLPDGERDATMDRLCQEEATRGFDLANGPLIRVGLIRMAAERHILTLTLHHIVCDGWSIRLILEEVRQLYSSVASGLTPALPEVAVQYSDYVIWQRERIEQGDFSEQLAFWVRKLAGYRRLQIHSPSSQPHGSPERNGAIVALPLSRDLTDRLKRFSDEQGGTMFSTTLAACMLLLRLHTGESDIAVGSPVAGRSSTELESLIGLLANHVVFRVQIADDPTFQEFSKFVRDTVWEAMANQDIPFAEVLTALKDSGEPCPDPFYRINFVCHRAFGGVGSLDFGTSGVRMSGIPSKSQGALYDLNFFLIERETGWSLSIEYDTNLYGEADARRLSQDFFRLLEAVAGDAHRRLSEFSISSAAMPMSDNETDRASGSAKAATAKGTQVDSLPETKGTAELSSVEAYELPAGVTQERFWLLTKIAPNSSAFNMPALVNISGPLLPDVLEASIQSVVDRHEILRTTFKEVDGRLVQHIAPNLKLSLSISDISDLEPNARDTRLADLLREEARQAFDLEKGPLCRARLIRLGSQDNVMAVTLHHIISDGWSQGIFQRDLWASYEALEGGRDPLLPPLAIQYADFTSWQNEWLLSEPSHDHLDYWLKQLGGPLPVLDIAPAIERAASVEGAIDTLQLPRELVERLKGLGQAENATTFMVMIAAFVVLLSRYSKQEDIIIGSPTASRRPETEALIGPFSTPIALRFSLPNGLTLRDAVRSASKVILDAFDHAEFPFEVLLKRLKFRSVRGRSPLFQFYFVYQTAFLQSKKLQQISITPRPTVSVGTPFELQLAVIDRADGVRANLDYDASRFDAATIRDLLHYYEYVLSMLVSDPDRQIASLDPPSGVRSPPTESISVKAEQDYAAPRNELQSRLAGMWEEIFELPRVGVRDDFFDLGGQSLLAAQLVSRIEKEFHRRIDLSMLLVDRTIEQLAERLASLEAAEAKSSLVAFRAGGTRPPLFCVHGGGGHVLTYQELAEGLSKDQPVFGLSAPELDGGRQSMTIDELAATYVRDIRQVQKEGPYYLCGYSFGGLVAYVMATLFEAGGHEVGLLAILDTSNRAYYSNLPFKEWTIFWMSFLAERARRYIERFRGWRFDIAAYSAFYFIYKNVRWRAWSAVRNAARFANRPMPKAFRDNITMFTVTAWSFDPKPFKGRVVLFRADELGPEYRHNVSLGWEKVAHGGVTVYYVTGNHRSFLLRPNVNKLIENLEKHLVS